MEQANERNLAAAMVFAQRNIPNSEDSSHFPASAGRENKCLRERQIGGQWMTSGVDRVGHDLQAVDQTRPRAAEVLRAVGDIDAAIAYRRQISPARHVVQ